MMEFSHFASVENQIRRLEEELYCSRQAIIRLMPANIQRILYGYYSCQSRKDTYVWERDAIDALIDTARILPPEEGSFLSDRAYCPLCGSGSSGPYQNGFSVPEGLRRHLLGWGNVRQCDLMAAAMKLARDYWEKEFREAEEQDERDKRKRLDERRKSETLYLIDPSASPCLFDESLEYGSAPRDEVQLNWAEQRLKILGFTISVESNVKVYSDERNNHIVFADPRALGYIVFRVYHNPLPKKSRRGSARHVSYRVFRMQDNWKHDLKAKYEKRVADSLS